MQKQKLLLMAALCAVALSGCKKKEPIDLSSLHTTAAVEKETMPVTSAAETTAAAAETESSSSGSTQAGSKYAVKTSVKSYTRGNASVEYPEVSNMKDSGKQKQVNELLRRNASAAADTYPLKDGQSLAVKASVESSNLKRLTVTYRGEIKSGTDTGRKLFFSNTVDLDTAQNLRLSDYTDAYTVAGYIASGDYKLESVKDEAAVRAYLNAADKTTDYYYKLLKNSDFADGYTEEAAAVTWPEVFSYEKQGIIYISLPVSPELGDYVIIRYSPDNK